MEILSFVSVKFNSPVYNYNISVTLGHNRVKKLPRSCLSLLFSHCNGLGLGHSFNDRFGMLFSCLRLRAWHFFAFLPSLIKKVWTNTHSINHYVMNRVAAWSLEWAEAVRSYSKFGLISELVVLSHTHICSLRSFCKHSEIFKKLLLISFTATWKLSRNFVLGYFLIRNLLKLYKFYPYNSNQNPNQMNIEF